MADKLTKEQRSYCMSRIRSKWTKQERTIHSYLKGNKIHHKMHPELMGNPDILLNKINAVIFLQGCFWHKCPKCYKEPKSNKDYWIPKIENNVKRDRTNTRKLRKAGYTVIKLWEHEVNSNIQKCLNKIKNTLTS